MAKAGQPGVSRGPSAAEIAEWILRQIRTRRFAPGQRLVEFDIVRMTGGSRFKVREALQRLAAEGLVEIEEYRGASVRNATMDEVRQLYKARGALEGICAAEFTRLATPEQRKELQRITDELERVVELGTPEVFGGLNAQWHGLIMEGSRNPIIRSLVQRLNTPIHHLLFETFYSADRLRSAAADHRVILQCIVANDAEGAQAAMCRHVEDGYRFLSTLDSAVHFD